MTSNTDFQRKLTQTANAAEKHHRLLMEVGEMFKERYGVHYSDIDGDTMIDVLDHSGGIITVEMCDQQMAERGYPKL